MAFNHQFLSALDTLLAQHGFTRTMKGSHITITDSAGRLDEGRQSLKFYGREFGLEEGDYGAMFTIGGKRFKLVGLKPSRPKYPLLGEHMGTGTIYKIPRSVVPQIQAARAARPATTASAPVTLSPPSNNAHNPYADIAQF